jgi:hypothetical protein
VQRYHDSIDPMSGITWVGKGVYFLYQYFLYQVSVLHLAQQQQFAAIALAVTAHPADVCTAQQQQRQQLLPQLLLHAAIL